MKARLRQIVDVGTAPGVKGLEVRQCALGQGERSCSYLLKSSRKSNPGFTSYE
jgi:hypothetical protein